MDNTQYYIQLNCTGKWIFSSIKFNHGQIGEDDKLLFGLDCDHAIVIYCKCIMYIYFFFLVHSVDWVVANMVALQHNSLGHVRYVIKDGLKYFPLYGFYFKQVSLLGINMKWNIYIYISQRSQVIVFEIFNFPFHTYKSVRPFTEFWWYPCFPPIW